MAEAPELCKLRLLRIASARDTEVSLTYYRKRFGVSRARVDHVTMAKRWGMAAPGRKGDVRQNQNIQSRDG